MPATVDLDALKRVMQEVKKLAKEYHQLTGKPLGITGEVGEIIAAHLLHLELKVARNPGYDAIWQYVRLIHINSRLILPNSKLSQRV